MKQKTKTAPQIIPTPVTLPSTLKVHLDEFKDAFNLDPVTQTAVELLIEMAYLTGHIQGKKSRRL